MAVRNWLNPSLAMVLAVFAWLPVSANELAVGQNSRINAEIRLPLAPPVVFNSRTKASILADRQKALNQFALLKGTYTPSEEVFGLVEDRKPWWGYKGMYVYREGSRSPEGVSKESRFILNPYLLVGADPTCIGLIDAKKVDSKVLDQPNFPYVWQPTELRYNPKLSRAEVTYDITGFQKLIKDNAKYMTGYFFINKFSLIAYNARDLGYEYIYPAVENSVNVSNRFTEKKPIQIRQMLHCGGSCGYPGGCNNMSPLMPELDYLQLSQYPASLTCYLWKTRPRDVQSKPDFTYVINFK